MIVSRCILICSLLARNAEKTLKDASKVVVKDGVDDRVQKAVDVAEPDEEREEDRVEAADGGQLEQIVADARGVDDVEREERDPAEQKDACISSRISTTDQSINHSSNQSVNQSINQSISGCVSRKC